jgi:uncharacterized protein YndB with AHSA1/START domain
MKAGEPNPVGRTNAAGWEIGVRRTLPLTPNQAWQLLTSDMGMSAWLGAPIVLEPQAHYQLSRGTRGKVTVYEPGSHLRLTWQLPGWSTPSVVQVRVLPARTGSTISFHQENLAGPSERESMRDHWTSMLNQLARCETSEPPQTKHRPLGRRQPG